MSERVSGTALPSILPIFPLTGVLLLPRGRLPLNIFEPRYLAMTQAALAGERLIGMVQPSDPRVAADNPPVYPTGCAGRITSFSETDDGRLRAYFQHHKIEADWDAVTSVPGERLVTSIAMICPFEPSEKQALLEAPDLDERARLLTAIVEMAALNPPRDGPGARH
jgi:Lon protease-like protein